MSIYLDVNPEGKIVLVCTDHRCGKKDPVVEYKWVYYTTVLPDRPNADQTLKVFAHHESVHRIRRY